MSGKFQTNRAARRKQSAKPVSKKKGKDNTLLCALIALLGVVLVVLVVYALSLDVYEAPGIPTTVPNSVQVTPTTDSPTQKPTDGPAGDPTTVPTDDPTIGPTEDPADDPTEDPVDDPTDDPVNDPTEGPTTPPTEDIQINVDPETEFDLGRGLIISDVGSYTGV